MSDCGQVVSTTGSGEEAPKIVRILVESRLAACAQVLGPIKSTYWWEGKVASDEEWQCAARTRRDLFTGVEQAIRRVNSCEVPEILALPVTAGSRDYLAWLEGEPVGRAES